MNIYVFGNPDYNNDNIAVKVAKQLILRRAQDAAANQSTTRHSISFIFQDPNEDFAPDEKKIIIMDAAKGIKETQLLEDLDKLRLHKSTTMHDFDIAFQLKFLKKIKRIQSVRIIAIPLDLSLKKATRQTKRIIKHTLFKSL